MKKVVLSLVALIALAVVSFVLLRPASAVVGDGSCTADYNCDGGKICKSGQCVVGCRDNGDCSSGYVCNTSTNQCYYSAPAPHACADTSLTHGGKTIIYASSSLGLAVGDSIQPHAYYRNTSTSSSTSCGTNSACTTPYTSQVNLNATCGNGYTCIYDYRSSLPSIKHKHTVGKNKYTITKYIGTCSVSGEQIFQITPCNC